MLSAAKKLSSGVLVDPENHLPVMPTDSLGSHSLGPWRTFLKNYLWG